jgi:RNA polymerase sigma factor (sigma-70 family)
MLDIQANYPLVCQVFARRFRHARSRGGRALKLDFEDTFQDMLLDLCRKQSGASAWDPARSGMVTYLWMVADSSIGNAIRGTSAGKRDRQDLGDEEDVALGIDLAHGGPDAEQELALSEEVASLRAAMALLSDEDRFVLEEHDGKGRALATVARDLGVSRQRVGQRVTDARARLRALLAERSS